MSTERRDLLAQAIDLGRQSLALLTAVALAEAMGRDAPPGMRARALDLSARASLMEATERLWGTSSSLGGSASDEPTWTPPAVAEVIPSGPSTEPPPDLFPTLREHLAATRAASEAVQREAAAAELLRQVDERNQREEALRAARAAAEPAPATTTGGEA